MAAASRAPRCSLRERIRAPGQVPRETRPSFACASHCRITHAMPLVVQKYGGTSVADPDRVLAVAGRVARARAAGNELVVVVSAMGKTTDDLLALARQVSEAPSKRELDMLLTVGERVTMALLAMALHDLDVQAISFTGSQSGILTDGNHSAARIVDVRPDRIRAELERGRVVIVAGFQGVNPATREITTLGRGGSDTTAVAMAAALKAERCEIIKDVDGICSADPRIVPDARPLRQVDFASLSEMCFWGAKILHFRSVELAQSQDVPLVLKQWGGAEHSTQVMKEVASMENGKVLAVNSMARIEHVEIDSKDLND